MPFNNTNILSFQTQFSDQTLYDIAGELNHEMK